MLRMLATRNAKKANSPVERGRDWADNTMEKLVGEQYATRAQAAWTVISQATDELRQRGLSKNDRLFWSSVLEYGEAVSKDEEKQDAKAAKSRRKKDR